MIPRDGTRFIECAEALGLTYPHLYMVLHLKRKCAGTLFDIESRFPHIFGRLRPSLRKRIAKYMEKMRDKYIFNECTGRFVMKPELVKEARRCRRNRRRRKVSPQAKEQ